MVTTDRSTWVAGWKIDGSPYRVQPESAYPVGTNPVVGHDGEYIDLLQPHQLANLPPGTVVISIFGDEAVKGRDKIDDDTRAGYTAYGIPCPRGVGDWSTLVHADD